MRTKTQGLLRAGIKTIYVSYPMATDNDGAIARRMEELIVGLRTSGFEIIDPQELAKSTRHVMDCRRQEVRYRDYMGADLLRICIDADAILLADEWKQSNGCRCEAFTAHTCDIIMLDERLTQLAPSVVMYECFQPAQ